MTDETPTLGAKLAPSPELPPLVHIEPVLVTLIGTKNDVIPTTGTVALTPGAGQPNIVVQRIITPLVAIGVRFANTFLTALLGILTGAMATNVIQASDFLHLVYKCAGLAVAGAGMGLIKDLVTVFGKLEQQNPLLTGSI